MPVPGFVQGSIAPVFTAFDDDGTFNPDGQRHLLDFMLERGGISAYFVRSGMGQMYAFLSSAEVRALAMTACKHLAGRAPVLVGASGIWDRNYDRRPPRGQYMDESAELGKIAADLGAAGVVYTIPEAIAPVHDETHAEVTLRYFEFLSGKVSLPIFIYQPPRTRPEYMLSPVLLHQLAQMDRICGVKVSYSDGDYLYSLVRATAGTHCAYIVGAETVFLFGLLIGARAVIGQGCVLNPQILNAVQQRLEAGDRVGAIRAQDAVNRLVHSGRNIQDFFKRYATEHGHPVPRHWRVLQSNPYGEPDPAPLSPQEYEAYKQRLEAELASFLG